MDGDGDEMCTAADLAVRGESERPPPSEKCGVGSGERLCALRCLWGVRRAWVGLAEDEEGSSKSSERPFLADARRSGATEVGVGVENEGVESDGFETGRDEHDTTIRSEAFTDHPAQGDTSETVSRSIGNGASTDV